MDEAKMGSTQKITVSALVMALYIAIMMLTRGFAFGQYQVRIATALYPAACLFPFLVIPLALANMLANLLLGGLGLLDVLGGGVVGLLTALCCALIGRLGWNDYLTAVPVAVIPALGASLWLSALLHISYWAMAVSLLVGQFICAVAGVVVLNALRRAWKKGGWKHGSPQ